VLLLAYEEGDWRTEQPTRVACQVGAWLIIAD
jgi:hypothetical protein